MNTSEFLESVHRSGLQHIAEAIAGSAEPCVYVGTEIMTDNAMPIAASKIGGNPDLPQDVVWPSWQGTKLAFLAQINLVDITALLSEGVLPKEGLLSVFYHPDQTTWGFDPKDQGSWRTYYFAGDSILSRRQTPDLNSNYLNKPYRACSLSFEVGVSFVSPFSEQIAKMGLSESEFERYWDLYDTLAKPQKHQLFGHPHIIQNPMEIECQLVTNGIYCGDANWGQHPRYEELREGVNDWRMLLQIDSDANAGMMWGDGGMLYFWIREGSLSKALLDETWMVLQCH